MKGRQWLHMCCSAKAGQGERYRDARSAPSPSEELRHEAHRPLGAWAHCSPTPSVGDVVTPSSLLPASPSGLFFPALTASSGDSSLHLWVSISISWRLLIKILSESIFRAKIGVGMRHLCNSLTLFFFQKWIMGSFQIELIDN